MALFRWFDSISFAAAFHCLWLARKTALFDFTYEENLRPNWADAWTKQAISTSVTSNGKESLESDRIKSLFVAVYCHLSSTSYQQCSDCRVHLIEQVDSSPGYEAFKLISSPQSTLSRPALRPLQTPPSAALFPSSIFTFFLTFFCFFLSTFWFLAFQVNIFQHLSFKVEICQKFDFFFRF